MLIPLEKWTFKAPKKTFKMLIPLEKWNFRYISALNDIEYVHHAMGRLGGDQSFTGDRLLLSQDIYKFLSKYQREAGAQLVFEFGGPNENHICIPSLFAYRCQFLGESLGRYADRILER